MPAFVSQPLDGPKPPPVPLAVFGDTMPDPGHLTISVIPQFGENAHQMMGTQQHHRAAGRVDLPRLVLEPDGALHHHSGGDVRGSAGFDARLWHHAEPVARHSHRHVGEALPPRDHLWLVESRHARHELPGHGQPARFAGGLRLARLSRIISTASKSISACPSRPAAITIWAAPC